MSKQNEVTIYPPSITPFSLGQPHRSWKNLRRRSRSPQENEMLLDTQNFDAMSKLQHLPMYSNDSTGSVDALYNQLPSADLDLLLEQLSTFTDDELWKVAYRTFSHYQSRQLSELTDKNKQGILTENESSELDVLLDLMDSYTLLRAEAIVLLKQRGQDISAYLKMRS